MGRLTFGAAEPLMRAAAPKKRGLKTTLESSHSLLSVEVGQLSALADVVCAEPQNPYVLRLVSTTAGLFYTQEHQSMEVRSWHLAILPTFNLTFENISILTLN